MSSGEETTQPGRPWSSLDDTAQTEDLDSFLRAAAAAPPVKLPPTDAARLAAGTIVDDVFCILEPLGEGGMGTVYLADHIELQRRVAIKVHRRQQDSAEDQALLNEAQAMAQLSHPNVVTVHRAGVVDGRVYIAMEYVRGSTLSAWVHTDPPRPWRAVVDMFIEVSRGLSAAHAAGLVHRDFKPDNVLIDTDGRPRVADFGLARAVDSPAATMSTTAGEHTVTGAEDHSGGRYHPTEGRIAGTPVYMSPEQFSGGALDARSDQYSFCVALYEALYGCRPYEAGSIIELSAAVVEGRLRAAPAGMTPRWLTAAVARGLSLHAHDRYPSMLALARVLRRGRTARRRGAWVGAAALGAGGVAWAAVLTAPNPCAAAGDRMGGIWGERQAAAMGERLRASGAPAADHYAEGLQRRLDAWTKDWADHATQSCEAAHDTTDDQAQIDRQQDCLRAAADQLAATVELLEEQPALTPGKADAALARLPAVTQCSDTHHLSLQVEPPQGPEQTGAVEAVRRRLARVEALLTFSHGADAVAEATAAVADARATDYPPLEAEALLRLGRAQYFQGDATAAEVSLTESYHLATNLGYDRVVVDTSAYLVSNAGALGGQPEQAERWGRHARAALARLGENPEASEQLHTALGNFELQRGALDEALAHHREALALAQRARPDDHSGTARALQNIGAVLRDQGDREGALEHLERALEIEQRQPDRSRENRAFAHHNIGVVLSDMGRVDQAEQRFTRALELKRQWLGPRHPALAPTLDGLGGIHETRGDNEAARQAYAQALEIRTAALGPDHPELAFSHTNLANALDGLGRREQAVEHHRRGLALIEAAHGPDHFRAGLVCNNLGYALLQMGRLAEARTQLERARDNWSAALGPKHVMLAYPLTNLGALALAEGDPASALPPLERGLAIIEEQSADPESSAELKLTLAQALWADPTQPARARAMLDEAYREMIAGGEATATLRAKLEAWASEHDITLPPAKP
ncbi:MAG: tetratricopeptide repeat protein [Deltaproteobacteria bacterium]|nr:tetratricopeptide repeat protein [Deltaproteobacteria bacterium]